MTNSIVARFYGEQIKMTRFLVILNNCLSFAVKVDTPVTAEQFRDDLEKNFGTPGQAILNEQAITLTDGTKAKDLIFSSDTLLDIKVFPLGTM